jgi:hypothetical protein
LEIKKRVKTPLLELEEHGLKIGKHGLKFGCKIEVLYQNIYLSLIPDIKIDTKKHSHKHLKVNKETNTQQ